MHPARPILPLALVLALSANVVAAARPAPRGAASAADHQAAWVRHQTLERESLFAGLPWRSIGPTVQGGRVVDIEPIPGEPYGFYVAYATGGVWKTTNNGVRFEPLSDALPTMVTGSIAVDPNHPQRLWVGGGESNSSRSSYGGLGMYRSDDGGKTFRAMGLADTDRIGAIVVNARNGDRVCAAALGKLYTTGGGRGVYCTEDGGKTWAQTLKPEGAWTGAIDLVADPSNAEILYAATWERSRTPWNLVESGAGSGIYKSADGGRSWNRLAGGLPQGDKVGRIGLSISASHPNTLYAAVDNWAPLPESLIDLGDRPLTLKRLRSMSKEQFLSQDPDEIEDFIRDNDFETALDASTLIERVKKDEVKVADLVRILEAANEGFSDQDVWGLEIYRSDDGGGSWRRTHEQPLREVTYTYGYYFGVVRVAPDNPERIYVVGVPMITSADGGKSWSTLQDPNVHVDYHAWWIDPTNAQRMLVGNDGGVDLSYDGGKTWIKLDAQPVGQFYTVNYDMATPYNVYGGLQDNGSLKGSSKTRWELGQDWSVVPPGCDGMHIAVDTRDNATVYAGCQFGIYLRNGPGGRQEVRPREQLTEPALRYNWNSPMLLSQHNQDIVYFGANRLFRSMDQGENWTAISGDLSSSKNRGDVPYATITSVSESPKEFGLIWAGTDDGHVWVSEGGGARWTEVSDGLPRDRWVSRVQASAHARDRAYVSLNGYRNDDIAAYVYVTDDLGKRWRSIAAGLPAEAVNVVREDPVNENVIYVGTDRGVYVSLDRGRNWQALQGGLPNVPVHDLVVHPRDRELIAGTHGRSVWVVDVLPVQELNADLQAKGAHLFPVEALSAERDWRARASLWFDDSEYLPRVDGTFWAAADGEAQFTVLDDNDMPVSRFTVTAKRGINTFRWNAMVEQALALAAEKARNDKAAKAADAKSEDNTKQQDSNGALAKTPYAESVRLGHRLFVLPGKYQIKLALNGAESTTALDVKAPEPRQPRAKPPMKIRGK
jgi:photosystem II stability/assembly factor-like uncharacterized protein